MIYDVIVGYSRGQLAIGYNAVRARIQKFQRLKNSAVDGTVYIYFAKI